MPKTRKLISFDWAIKKLLRSKVNFEVLEGFLSELLFEDIKILEVLESESNKETKIDKSNRVDLKVKNSKDEIILIEVQYSAELDYMQRVLYATSKTIIEHIDEGKPFSKIKKVISVSILYFDFGEGDDYIYKGTTSFIGFHNNTKLKLDSFQKKLYKTDSIEKIYPEHYLIKINNFNTVSKDGLDEWIYFLKNEEIKDNFKAKGLQKAKEALNYLKMPEDERIEYEKYKMDRHYEASMYESSYVVGKIEGIEEGIEQGIEQGIEKEKINSKIREKNLKLELAKSLFDILDIEMIALKTGLSIEEIKILKDKK